MSDAPEPAEPMTQLAEGAVQSGNVSGETDGSGLTHAELLDVAGILADMIDGEWPGPLSYSVNTWGPATTPEQMAAVQKLETYLDSRRQ